MNTNSVKRRYQRVSTAQNARVVSKGWYWDKLHEAIAEIFQLGPMGCGLACANFDFHRDQIIDLQIPTEAISPLKICARIVWKKIIPGELLCRYGLQFLWIRKNAGEELLDPVTLKLNRILRPTGYGLLPG